MLGIENGMFLKKHSRSFRQNFPTYFGQKMMKGIKLMSNHVDDSNAKSC